MYEASDKMSELICGNHESLQVLSRFGLPLGFNDKTVAQVCDEFHVHTNTFLAVVNYKLVSPDEQSSTKNVTNISNISVETLMDYLRRAHCYFLDFCLPMIRRKLIEAINCDGSENNKIPFLIIKFFDEYRMEVRRHMEHENKLVFSYVDNLLKGVKSDNYNIDIFAKQHRAVDDKHIEAKLSELKDIIIKYYPSQSSNDLLNSALFDIFTCEKDLATHCEIEDNLLIPAVRRLEGQPTVSVSKTHAAQEQEELSDREKEVLIEIVKGLSNKEVAEKLFISVHTVITHRKNIVRKLNIHSSAGLTIYAIVNNMIDINTLG